MSLDERLAAVERALTDDEVEPAARSEAATVERRLDAVEERLRPRWSDYGHGGLYSSTETSVQHRAGASHRSVVSTSTSISPGVGWLMDARLQSAHDNRMSPRAGSLGSR